MRWSVGIVADADRVLSREEIVELADAVAASAGIATGIGTNRCRRRFEEQRQRLEEWIEGSSLLRLIATPGC